MDIVSIVLGSSRVICTVSVVLGRSMVKDTVSGKQQGDLHSQCCVEKERDERETFWSED